MTHSDARRVDPNVTLSPQKRHGFVTPIAYTFTDIGV